MSTSIYIARILGPCFIVVAISIMLNQDFYKKVFDDFFKNTALIYISGLIPLVLGIVIVLSHNVWVTDWTVMITIFGWMAVIKGIWLIVFPKSLPGFVKAYQRYPNLLLFHAILALALGIILVHLSYFA
jgi:hypothetical protein